MTTEASKIGEIKYNEEYADANAVTLRWDEASKRFVARHADGDSPCGTVVAIKKRHRPALRTRPPAPPVTRTAEKGRLALVPVPALPSTVDLPDAHLPMEFDTALKADAAHQEARRKYRSIWNEVYGQQDNDRHRRRVLELIDVNNEIASAASAVAFRLGLLSAGPKAGTP